MTLKPITLAAALCGILFSIQARAGDTEHWSMGPLGGTFQIVTSSNMLTVQSAPAGTPAAAAGLQVGDRIIGAFGENFRPINSYYTGSVQDFSSAIDRAEGSGGNLPLRVLRPGVGLVNLTATLPATGYFGPAFPLGSPKFDTLFETSCAQIHANTPSWFGSGTLGATNGRLTNLGWMGLVMLSHPNWADTSGAKPYRNSINTMRNQAVAVLDGIVLAPVKSGQPGFVDPGLENWQIAAITMFLAEYVNRTGDNSVMPTLQRACDALANRIQQNGSYDGHMGHGGVEGDYGNWALNIINVHTHAAFAFAKRAGANINQSKWDLSWNILKQSTARSNGHREDGYVDYGPPAWSQGSGWDAAGRTPGAFFGFMNYGQSPTADDTDALTRMKNYVVRNHERFQIAHAYTVGGTGFTHLALPYLSDREQRHILDNLRYFYQFHRTSNPNTLAYFGGRGNNGGDSYLNFEHVKLYNAALAKAVFNGGLPSLPGVNQDRILVHMKSPWTRWPTLEAKTATLIGLSHNLDVDITDWQGTPISSGFTAQWSKISGPGTVTFGDASQPSTTVDFSSGGRHRLQLTATAGSYTVTELYDFDVLAAATPGGYVPGLATWDLYSGISGNTVATLTGHSSFPDAPSTTGVVTTLDLPHRAESYGQRVRGVIIPPASGSYRFHIASDDSSQFRFNPAGPEDGGSVVCSVGSAVTAYNWTAQPNQQSALFELTGGQPYFFEILHKEGAGGDHCAVAWTGPGMASPTIIGAESIAAPDTAEILRHPVSRIAVPGGTANFDVLVRGPGPFLYEWRLDDVPYWGQSTSSALTVPNISPSSAGEYSCVITTPTGTITTQAATLSLSTTAQTVQGLRREVWNGISGSTITNLTGDSRFPRFPDSTAIVDSAETPENSADNYGQRLSGWVIPPTTGNYRFYLSSDDASQLWLSTDDSPSNKTQRAQITGYTSYRTYSASTADIALTAGQRYYIEILHKEGGGGDHLSLAWRLPGGSAPVTGSAPIPGEYLQCETHIPDPLSNGLVAWWRMDEGVGNTAMDATSTAADGAINGATWTTGRRAGGLQFNGAQSVLCGTRASLSGTTAFTLSAWVRVNAGTTQQGTIIQQRATDGFNGQYRFYVNSTGRLGFYVYGNSAEQFNFTGATAINNGNWHHVAAVRDTAGNAYIYLNGVLDGSITGTTQRSLSSSISVGIGADIRDSVNFFRGTLDDIRIFNRDLSAGEIAQIRNQSPIITPATIDLGLIPVGEAYSLDLGSYLGDPDIGETFTWEKTSGPAWLGVSSAGTASGLPAAGDAGSPVFTVRVTDSAGATADATLTANVAIVGPPPATVTITASPSELWEDDGIPASFTLTRDLTDGPLTISLAASGSASAGTDFVAPEDSITFADGEATSTLDITLLDDAVADGVKTLLLTLQPGAGYAIGSPGSATVQILDNEGPQPIADPWSEQNIGSVAVGNSSSVTYAAGVAGSDLFSITGSGTLGQNTTSDGFRFVSMPVTGDCEIVARVISQNTSGNGMRAGVMIRESTAADSRHATMMLRGDVQPWFVYRSSTGGLSTRTAGSNTSPPHWVRVRREGDIFTAALSPDGVNWTSLGAAQTISMGTTPLVGLVVASGSTAATNEATFDQVSIRHQLTILTAGGGSTGGAGWHPRLSERPITATPATNYAFISWTGSGIADPNSASTTVLIDGAKTVTANFALIEHALTVVGGSGSGTFPQGSSQPITATPPENYEFVSWTGDGIADPNSASTTVLIDTAKTVTANFALIEHALTVVGGSGSGTFPQGTLQPITAAPPENYEFVSWTGDGIADPNSASTTVLIDTAKTVTANFALIEHALTVVGGSGSGTFPQGTLQPITAAPPENYEFVSWTGDGIADPNSASTTVLIDTAKTVTANFALIEHALTVVGGSGSGTFPQGSSQPITATPPENYEFVSWTGDGIADPNSASTTVRIDAAKSVTANFALIEHALTVVGGSGSGTFPQGSSQPIAAAPPENYEFVSWTGDGIADPNSASTTVLIDTAKTVTANFALIEHALTVVGGSGSGTFPQGSSQPITAAPPENYEFVSWAGDGIADPNSASTSVLIDTAKTVTANFALIEHALTVVGGSGSGTFPQGSSQPITAAPPENYEFVSWAGDGIADPNSASTTVLIDGAKTVTANFALIEHALTVVGGSGSGTFPQGSSQPITAAPPENYEFVSWIGDGIADPNSASTTVLIDAAKTVTANFEMIVTDPYDDWAGLYELSGENRDPSADPDRDGLTNLMEFAFGGDPTDAGTSPLVGSFTDNENGSYLTLTVPRNPDSIGRVEVIVEFSSDLDGGDWSAVGAVVLTETTESLVVRDSVAVDESNRRFARARVRLLP